MFIPRIAASKLKQLASTFPVVALLGPRQSGKTTLAKTVFSHFAYVNLENLAMRDFAAHDPCYFLDTYSKKQGLIIDEIQHVPELFSYIQVRVDESQKMGGFILTGSQNFLLHEKIAQSLAGRIAILTLLPLSFDEIKSLKKNFPYYEEILFNGGYPRIYAEKTTALDWYPNYIRTYLERDVRQIKNVTDLMSFQYFVKLCAGRIGQLVNWSDLGRDAGISYNTAKAWISLLESSYILFLLQPYHKNFSKRLVKSPKLYFYDTGLACSLLGIESVKQLETHYLKGNLFESFILSELMKARLNQGLGPNCYFFRDHTGHEIDCILENADHVKLIEIKSGRTITSDFLEGFAYWKKPIEQQKSSAFLVYGGRELQTRTIASIVPWNALSSITTMFTN